MFRTASPEATIAGLLRALWCRRYLIGMEMLLVSVVGLGRSLMYPRVYGSEAMLLARWRHDLGELAVARQLAAAQTRGVALWPRLAELAPLEMTSETTGPNETAEMQDLLCMPQLQEKQLSSTFSTDQQMHQANTSA